MSASNLLRRITAAEKEPEPGESYYLSPEQVDSEIEWIKAGGEPRIDWYRIRDTITHKISQLHIEENHPYPTAWQSCRICQTRLAR